MAETKGSGPGYLPNGSLWVTPTFDNASWFPYGGIKDQMIDAQRAWATGAGAFAGNNVPKFNGIAGSDPNGTFGGGMTTMQPFVGGGLLGKTAYSGGFNPFAGRGNGGPGAGGGAPPPPSGGAPPPGGGGIPSPFPPGSPMTRDPRTTAPPPTTLPPGGLIPAASGPPTQPGSTWSGAGAPPPGGIAGAAMGGAVPVKMTPTSGPPRPGGVSGSGGLLGGAPTAGPSIMPEGWGSPPPQSAMQNPQAIQWARSQNPQDAMKLQEMYGPLVRAQMDMYYNQGGPGFDPQKSADQTRGESGGIDSLMVPIRAMYEQAGIIVNGKWAKKQDNNGNWIPV